VQSEDLTATADLVDGGTNIPASPETATPEETASYLQLATPPAMDIETVISVGRAAKPQQPDTGRPNLPHTT
jgi:hypothetical protein